MNSETKNHKLQIEPSPVDFGEELAEGLKLPVITLEDRSLLPWSKFLAGNSTYAIPGILLKKIEYEQWGGFDDDDDEIIISDLTPRDRLDL